MLLVCCALDDPVVAVAQDFTPKSNRGSFVFDCETFNDVVEVKCVGFTNADACYFEDLLILKYVRSLVGTVVLYFAESRFEIMGSLDVGVLLLGSHETEEELFLGE